MGESSATISIIMPLYNKERWVANTVRSILSQSFKDFELIVVDDGSIDRSLEIIREFRDSRIKIITQKNSGVSSARNRGVLEANGKFITFIDADDIWLDRHLEYLIRAFEKYPNIILSANKISVCTDEIYPIDITQNRNIEYKKYNYIDSLYKNQFPIHIGSIMVKRDLFNKIDGFYEDMKIAEDVNWILRANCQGEALISNYIGMIYYLIDSNGAMLSNRDIKYLPKYLRGLDLSKCQISDILKLKKFIFIEYLKKAYQNRGYPLNIKELQSREASTKYKLGSWSIFFYLIVRYIPKFIYTTIKRLKAKNG